jgi:hypothetical protein
MNPFETFQTLGLVPKNVYQVRYPNIPLESVQTGSIKVLNPIFSSRKLEQKWMFQFLTYHWMQNIM